LPKEWKNLMSPNHMYAPQTAGRLRWESDWVPLKDINLNYIRNSIDALRRRRHMPNCPEFQPLYF